MNKDYVGYTLFDKVTIVAKNIIERYDWEGNMCIPVFSDRWQGYVVDPSNKSMLKSALEWGKQTKSIYKDGKYDHNEVIEPQVFEFENNGWKMEILRTADGSSQGGKLSFWTCKVSKDGKDFEVGINADLLLDIIKSQTLVRGSCDKEFMFARCKGGVGLLCEDMPEYKQALNDMQKKQDVKSKKTSKHVLGHAYSALNLVEAYVADLWVHYEPMVKTSPRRSGWSTYEVTEVVGFRKLEKPIKLKWFPHLYDYEPGDVIKLSEGKYFDFDTDMLKAKLPARLDCGVAIEYDITLEEAVKKFYWDKWLRNYDDSKQHYCRHFYPHEKFGVSTSETECPIPQEVLDVLKRRGLQIEL